MMVISEAIARHEQWPVLLSTLVHLSVAVRHQSGSSLL
jgi:hypothetical protein